MPPTTWTSGWHLNYESLFKFAKTGKYFWDGYCDLEGIHHYCHERPFYINQGSRDYFIWEILGRIAHLIGDMCTPAHVHNDVHALGDFYETTMNFEFATQWDHSDALLAGGFFDVNGKQDPLRYLIYTINQITAYFPSDDADGNRNYIVTHGFDYYHELQSFMSTHLNPPNRNYINVNEIANVCFVNSIRAVAGLLYWFALETDLLDNTSVINNFGGGFIKVDFNNCYSNYRIKAWDNQNIITVDAIDQAYGDCYWRFQSWDKIQNGTIVETFNSRTITIIPTANTTYRANFRSENSFNFIVSGPTKGLYRGESRTYKIFPQYGNPSASYHWRTKYRVIQSGQTFWEDGLPLDCGIDFIYNPPGNTAILKNV